MPVSDWIPATKQIMVIKMVGIIILSLAYNIISKDFKFEKKVWHFEIEFKRLTR